MPLALTPRLLRRGLELFAVISLIGVLLVLVFFGENLQGFLSGLANLGWGWMLRSEEHTSELQSRSDLVCRLLLEKKKKSKKNVSATLECLYARSVQHIPCV